MPSAMNDEVDLSNILIYPIILAYQNHLDKFSNITTVVTKVLYNKLDD